VLGHTVPVTYSTAFSRVTARRTALDELVAGTKAVQRQFFGDEPNDSVVRRQDRAPKNSAKHMEVTAPGDWSDRMYPHNAKQAAFDAIDLALMRYRIERLGIK